MLPVQAATVSDQQYPQLVHQEEEDPGKLDDFPFSPKQGNGSGTFRTALWETDSRKDFRKDWDPGFSIGDSKRISPDPAVSQSLTITVSIYRRQRFRYYPPLLFFIY
jgi:hypothetical protein